MEEPKEGEEGCEMLPFRCNHDLATFIALQDLIPVWMGVGDIIFRLYSIFRWRVTGGRDRIDFY